MSRTIARLVAALGFGVGLGLDPNIAIVREPIATVPSRKSIKRRHVRARMGGHIPHQGTRECLRRVGGEAWARFKEADRVRRGLPPHK